MSARGFLSSRSQGVSASLGSLRAGGAGNSVCVCVCVRVLWVSTSQWACFVCARQLVHVYVCKHLPASFSVLIVPDTQLSVGSWLHTAHLRVHVYFCASAGQGTICALCSGGLHGGYGSVGLHGREMTLAAWPGFSLSQALSVPSPICGRDS